MPYYPVPDTEAGTLKYTGADQSLGTLAQDNFNLSWSLGLATYEFHFEGCFTVVTGTPQIEMGFNYTGTASVVSIRQINNTTTFSSPSLYRFYVPIPPVTGPVAISLGAGGVASGQSIVGSFSGMITTSVAGTFTFQSRISSGSCNCLLGTFGKVSIS